MLTYARGRRSTSIAPLDGADLVLVHEWNAPALVERLGRHRLAGGRYLLLFHDTHHRAVTEPATRWPRYDLEGYDGVLAFGAALRELYLAARLGAAGLDLARGGRLRALPSAARQRAEELDLVWIGNWGDDERTAELARVPARAGRGPRPRGARVHGVRYPERGAARAAPPRASSYRGWLPNHRGAAGLRPRTA